MPGRAAPATRAPVLAARSGRDPLLTTADWPLWLAVVFLLLFAALTVLVATGATHALDERMVHHFRPADEWGDIQKRYGPWMSRLNPVRMYLVLAATALIMSVWRRSWWPALFGVVLAATSMTLTVMAKLAFERPDPHGYVASSGGSYPSGHVVAVLVCLGGCLLLVFPKVHWWLWAAALPAFGLLTAALVFAAAHWSSDVLGGALLALALVSGSSRWSLRRRAVRTPSSRRRRLT